MDANTLVTFLIVGAVIFVVVFDKVKVLIRNLLMSSGDTGVDAATGTQVVHVPVPSTSTAAGTTSERASGTGINKPDTNAAEAGTEGWEAPRLSLRPTDQEMIAYLAVVRGKDGKHRYSANAIHDLVGGSRADVLAQIKAIREGTPAVFAPLTDEQSAFREQLQLDQR
jgi:hypothetical protein